MKIKKFNEMKSGDMYDYGCVMVYLDIPNWEEIVSSINHQDLYLPEDPTRGYETDPPHATILYGLHPEVTDEDVRNVVQSQNLSNIILDINGIDTFQTKDYDVVKMDVKSDILNLLNREMSKLPHTTDYPDYRPHVTMAYVKSGQGKKYHRPDFSHKFNNIKKIVYSKTNGDKIEIPLI
jgi:2'-5' RNA ligase